jgi:RNA polymerase sigma-70 factor (ECF subfamily)
VASMTTPSEAFSRNAKVARMQEAIAQLPAEHREALRLRYGENLPSKEVAQRMGKTDAAVRVMLTRSIRKLQELLGVGEETT